jgi:hypothetical protein
MIQPGEIARLAHRLGLGDKTIEKDLTWTLLAIAESPCAIVWPSRAVQRLRRFMYQTQ